MTLTPHKNGYLPLPQNGSWTDLLNNNAVFNATNYSLPGFAVQSNWGAILHFGS